MRSYDGVLFDWSGTLVYDPPHEERLRWALRCLDRPSDDRSIAELLVHLSEAALLPEVVEAVHDSDSSAERHRIGEMLWFEKAGLDLELAERLYVFDNQPPNRPLFPDVLSVLHALRTAEVRVAVISDIHFDVRPLLAVHDAADLIDGYALSYEQGVQKPDPRLFMIALDQLGTAAERTLMVGDLPFRDGGAVDVGIPTVILPRRNARRDRPRLMPLQALLDGGP